MGFHFPSLKANSSLEGVGPKKTTRKIQLAESKFLFSHLFLSSLPLLGEGASSSILAGTPLGVYPVVFLLEKCISYFPGFYDKLL